MPPASELKRGEVELLRWLALSGGDRTPVILSSREAGARLGVSQQAAANYLVHLADGGWVQRTLSGRRQRVGLTPSGLEFLRHEYHGLRRLFEGPDRLKIHGLVASGLGEGRYYLSQPGYVVQFAERLGYTPYPGTLNVRVDPEGLLRANTVRHWSGIRIDGFDASGRTFGGATCFGARLDGRACHLIVPDRTHHTDVLEFIAPEFLRGALNVKDGSRVAIELQEA